MICGERKRKIVIDLTEDDDKIPSENTSLEKISFESQLAEIRKRRKADFQCERQKAEKSKPVAFVLAPGSGNGMAGITPICASLGCRVERLKKWAGIEYKHMETNMQMITKLAESCLDSNIVFVGYSYGCRVIARLLASRPDLARCALFISYPLFDPVPPNRAHNGMFRADELASVPSHVTLRLMSGASDHFLATHWQPLPQGPDALRMTMKRTKATSSLHVLPDTGHCIHFDSDSRAIRPLLSSLDELRKVAAASPGLSSPP